MTRYLLIALIFLLSGTISMPAQAKKKAHIRCDTVAAGAQVCAGMNIVSCTVTVIYGMVIIVNENHSDDGCIRESARYKSETVIYFEDIISSPRPGVLVKEPPLKIYVK